MRVSDKESPEDSFSVYLGVVLEVGGGDGHNLSQQWQHLIQIHIMNNGATLARPRPFTFNT